MGTQQASTQQAVLFRLGSEWFGADVAYVREVIRVPLIAPLPFTPAHVRGIAVLRGEFVSVIDLATALHRTAPISSPTRLVMVAANGLDAAFLVDEVTNVVHVKRQGAAATASWRERDVCMLEIPSLLEATRLGSV